jgi:carbohydrate-binding DOMON domain-containing protein
MAINATYAYVYLKGNKVILSNSHAVCEMIFNKKDRNYNNIITKESTATTKTKTKATTSTTTTTTTRTTTATRATRATTATTATTTTTIHNRNSISDYYYNYNKSKSAKIILENPCAILILFELRIETSVYTAQNKTC